MEINPQDDINDNSTKTTEAVIVDENEPNQIELEKTHSSWQLFKESFRQAMKTDEMDFDMLSFNDVVKWVKQYLPKGCSKAVLIYSNPDWITQARKNYKYHFCSVFCDDAMNIIEDSRWGFFHCHSIDEVLKLNFGNNDMIVLA